MVSKDFEEIKQIIEESTGNRKRTCIVQKYIHNPLLIKQRKFDIRAFAFLSSINGNLKGYFYEEGYLRTSCKEFSLANLGNRMIHLTNDAVQKKAEDYGRFEPGNKLSYLDFQNYLDKNFPDLNICFQRDLYPQMKVRLTRIDFNHRNLLLIPLEPSTRRLIQRKGSTPLKFTATTSCSMRISRCT